MVKISLPGWTLSKCLAKTVVVLWCVAWLWLGRFAWSVKCHLQIRAVGTRRCIDLLIWPTTVPTEDNRCRAIIFSAFISNYTLGTNAMF